MDNLEDVKEETENVDWSDLANDDDLFDDNWDGTLKTD